MFGKILSVYPFFTGIIVGVFVNLSVTNFECTDVISPGIPVDPSGFNYSTIKTEWKSNASRRSTREPAKPVRPRYYSTELGIRQKVFIGVLTSEERTPTLAVHLNRTLGAQFDAARFFITARRRGGLNYSDVVGFTDTRNRYRPFQVLKHLADNYLQDYDYFFLANDFDYVNSRRLRSIAEKISVSMHVYLGNPVPDSSYCNLDSGILISNSVLAALKEHLEWCVMNAVTDDHSDNLGRCVYKSTKLDCQEEVQGQRLPVYKLKHSMLDKMMPKLIRSEDFNRAVTVYPILQAQDFYLLNAHYLKQELVKIKNERDELSKDLTETWPPGERTGSVPATRFDLPLQHYFNGTHMFFPDDFTNIRKHTTTDLDDIERVIKYVKLKVSNDQPDEFRFLRLINGYRTFDLARGLDYKLDLGFRDLRTGKEVIKRFEVCKPLGRVDLIPAPYVTENSRVTVLLPVQEHRVIEAEAFLTRYTHEVMEKREKASLMLVFLYQSNSTSKGDGDVFAGLKRVAVELSEKFRSDDTKIAWVSIRLPGTDDYITVEDYTVLNFAVVELALKKTGVDCLVLILDVYANIGLDFLNRVRMNTIAGYQIFSPIPFRFYDPDVSHNDKLELNKNTGHFDREEYKFVSFYARDYIAARKKMKGDVPLVRSDYDIGRLLTAELRNLGNVFDMFVKYGETGVHCLRAPDSSLKLSHHETDPSRRNWFIGTQTQLAKFILGSEL